MKSRITEIQLTAESWSPQDVLSWSFQTFGDEVALASAFGASGMVLIDMASRLRKDFRLFTLDTEFLFPETCHLIDKIEQKYEIKVERVLSSLSPEEQERVHGAGLWVRDPDRCCDLRKVEPLRRKLGASRSPPSPRSASPARHPIRPALRTWPATSGSSGRLSLVTGCATPCIKRTNPRSEPEMAPESWLLSATSQSGHSEWPDVPTSPKPPDGQDAPWTAHSPSSDSHHDLGTAVHGMLTAALAGGEPVRRKKRNPQFGFG